MNKLLITLLINLLITCWNICGQNVNSVDNWMEFVDELSTSIADERQIEILFDELSYLADHPFELNSVTVNQLRVLPFLTDKQVENIISHRDKYGKFLTVYELKNVKDLDFQTIKLLLPFVYIGEIVVDKRPVTVSNLLKYGSNELQLRYDRCFQRKKGYDQQPDSILEKYPNRRYLGEPFYHAIRYSYTFDNRIQAGLVAEKDAGEPFWNEHHKGYDYYSFHLFLKDMNRLKSLAVGDYKVSFGQGLVVSQEFTPSRNSIVTQAERRTHGFRRHYSTNENDFFRGAAATVNVNNVDISAFFSNKSLDATRAGNDTVSSLKTDGLHRLVREREKQRVLHQCVFGGNIRYATPGICIGVTAVTHSFNGYRLEPDPKPYNLFHFRGSSNTNISVDYLFTNRLLKFYGETALSQNKALATLNALQLTPVSYISFLLLHRYYDKKYQSFFGSAFSQNTTVQNEQGIYVGMQFTPFAYWKLSLYGDFFRFPWLKYGVDAPSSGTEYMAQIDYTQLKNLSFYVRYKYKKKEKNGSVEDQHIVPIISYTQQRIRFQMQYGAEAVSFKTAAEGILYNESGNKKSRGVMLSQGMGWKPGKLPFRWDIYGAWFHTDNYYSRLSSYEKNILYAFSTPQFYGRGIRLATTFQWNIIERLSLSAKFACTRYSDRDKIGTDLEEIDGNIKTDMNALLRWKF